MIWPTENMLCRTLQTSVHARFLESGFSQLAGTSVVTAAQMGTQKIQWVRMPLWLLFWVPYIPPLEDILPVSTTATTTGCMSTNTISGNIHKHFRRTNVLCSVSLSNPQGILTLHVSGVLQLCVTRHLYRSNHRTDLVYRAPTELYVPAGQRMGILLFTNLLMKLGNGCAYVWTRTGLMHQVLIGFY